VTPHFDAAELFARLHQANVRYVVIGGFAVIAHGAQRYTKDLDICPDPDPENLTRLAHLLGELGATQIGDFAGQEMHTTQPDPRRRQYRHQPAPTGPPTGVLPLKTLHQEKAHCRPPNAREQTLT
jgi:hypothetical protein